MEWRSEDTRYAVATAAAFVIVAFLIAGNFGLAPSPLSRSAPDPIRTRALVPAPAATPPPGTVTAASQGPDPLLEIVVGTPEPPPRPDRPTAPPADRTSPTSRFTTADDAVLVGGSVTGHTTDEGSGVRRVVVTFELLGGASQTDVAAELDCAPGRRSCSWSADPPTAAGTWRAQASGEDREGNVERDGPTISVTIVTTETGTPTASETDGSEGSGLLTSLVSGVVDAVAGLL